MIRTAARKWTPQEDAYLRRSYPVISDITKVAQHLNRPVSAIWSRAKLLRLNRHGQPRRARPPCPWTAEQLEYLRRSWGKETLTAIAARLRTYPRTAKHRAASLGLDPTIYDGKTMSPWTEPARFKLPTPTDAPPGSEAKIQVLMDRVARGEVLFHHKDRKADAR